MRDQEARSETADGDAMARVMRKEKRRRGDGAPAKRRKRSGGGGAAETLGTSFLHSSLQHSLFIKKRDFKTYTYTHNVHLFVTVVQYNNVTTF